MDAESGDSGGGGGTYVAVDASQIGGLILVQFTCISAFETTATIVIFWFCLVSDSFAPIRLISS